MLRDGFLIIGRWRGVPIRIHWSTPIGALLFSRFRFAPGFWLGFVLVIVIHELGHAFVVQQVRARVLSVDVFAIGGLCTWQGRVSKVQRACIAWGGVWAQMILYVLTLTWLAFVPVTSQTVAELAAVFTTTNLWIIAINLLPVPPLDGAEAWRLVSLLRERWMKRWRTWRYTRATDSVRRDLAKLDEIETDRPSPDVKALVDRIVADAKRDDAD